MLDELVLSLIALEKSDFEIINSIAFECPSNYVMYMLVEFYRNAIYTSSSYLISSTTQKCFFNRPFRLSTTKTQKRRINSLWEIHLVTGRFLSHRTSNVEDVPCHDVIIRTLPEGTKINMGTFSDFIYSIVVIYRSILPITFTVTS